MSPRAYGVGSVTNVKRGLQDALLGDRFAAAMQEAQEAFADGLLLPGLAEVVRCERGAQLNFPGAELIAVATHPTGDSTSTDSGAEHVVAVRFMVGGDDEQLITDQLERYVLAFMFMCGREPGRELLLFPFCASSPVDVRNVDYDPAVRDPRAAGRFVKVATIEVVTLTHE